MTKHALATSATEHLLRVSAYGVFNRAPPMVVVSPGSASGAFNNEQAGANNWMKLFCLQHSTFFNHLPVCSPDTRAVAGAAVSLRSVAIDRFPPNSSALSFNLAAPVARVFSAALSLIMFPKPNKSNFTTESAARKNFGA